MRPGNETGPGSPETRILSAATRPGLSVDVERALAERWAIRLETAFTRSPLSVRVADSEGTELESGELDVNTLMLPVVFRINPRGSLRFHVMGGPAVAVYTPRKRTTSSGLIVTAPFEDARTEAGIAFGGGVSWAINDRFEVEGNLTDTITTSPFRKSDFPDVPGIETPRPHNVHTTVGVRWRF
jgi:hypothetical protein